MSTDQRVVAYPFISAPLEVAAAHSGVSVTTLRQAIADGDLIARYIGSKATKPVVRAVDLDEWLQTLPTERRAS